ncbi:hypothetical protein ACQGRZ_28650 [Bacillus wiedmannii]|uniref:hypothetical protein n=1 Tax=Bacillus wiedmannii TaxID=1890302 RepID=UPI003CE7D2E9
MNMLLEIELKEKGFTEDDIAVISNHFECDVNILDWEEIMLFENDEAIFNYYFIDDQDKEAILETLLKMGRVTPEDLEDGQTVMGYMVDDGDEAIFKLSNGRWAVVSQDLLDKEARQQASI